MLDVITSLVHLKIKYHNLLRKLETINADLEGEKRIYMALHKDKGEGIAMELNVISLIQQLNRMGIHPPKSG